jgi:hypothetical protein
MIYLNILFKRIFNLFFTTKKIKIQSFIPDRCFTKQTVGGCHQKEWRRGGGQTNVGQKPADLSNTGRNYP